MITNSDLDLIAHDVAETLTWREGHADACGDPRPSEPDVGDEVPRA